MRKVFCLLMLVFGMTVFMNRDAQATIIFYDIANIGADAWEYNYKVVNDSLPFDIDEFTIYFTHGLYDGLNVTTPVVGWDEIVADPDTILGVPEDGFYDAAATAGGITQGDSKEGYSVSFQSTDSKTPGSQYYEIVDPSNFEVIDQGNTVPFGQDATVPEPATMVLLGSGLLALPFLRRKV